VPPVGDVLPPPVAECQLPGDLMEGYGIKETRVLTTGEAHVWWVWGIHVDGRCFFAMELA
jgi:hypothetical protein